MDDKTVKQWQHLHILVSIKLILNTRTVLHSYQVVCIREEFTSRCCKTVNAMPCGEWKFSAKTLVTQVLKQIFLAFSLRWSRLLPHRLKDNEQAETVNSRCLAWRHVIKPATDYSIGETYADKEDSGRVDDGSHPHQFSSPCDYYKHLYFQTCDLLLNELQDCFQVNCSLAPVLALESQLIKAANGGDYNYKIASRWIVVKHQFWHWNHCSSKQLTERIIIPKCSP